MASKALRFQYMRQIHQFIQCMKKRAHKAKSAYKGEIYFVWSSDAPFTLTTMEHRLDEEEPPAYSTIIESTLERIGLLHFDPDLQLNSKEDYFIDFINEATGVV